MILIFFYPTYGFKTIQKDLKFITLPAPSYNPHQQPFAKKLTHYPRVIARKLRYIRIRMEHDQIIEHQEQDKPGDYQKQTPNDNINLGEEGRDSKDKLCNYHQKKLSLRLLLMSFDNAVREGDAQWLVDI